LVHSNLIWLLDAVPDAKVATVLGNYHVRVWHPGYELAVIQQSRFSLLFDVVQVELSSLIPEQKFGTSGVKLEVVDL
jgi:hypothetical protein